MLLLVAEPDWLLEAGFQLSFLSVLAIALSAAPVVSECLNPLFKPMMHCGDQKRLFLEQGAWHRRGRRLRVHCEIAIEQLSDGMPSPLSRISYSASRLIAGIVHSTASMIAVSISVQLWLQPILAYYFNRMSWISPVANLIIVPFSSIVLAAGIAAAALANIPVIGPAIIKGAGTLAALLLSCADHAAKIPGAWQRCPTPGVASILTAIILLFSWSFFRWRSYWIPCAYAAILLVCVSSASVPIAGKLFIQFRASLGIEKKENWPENAPVLGFTFLDVGEGDSIVISFPDKKLWLLDAGGLRQPSGTSGGL